MARTAAISAAALTLAAAGLWWLQASSGADEDEEGDERVPKADVLKFFAELQQKMPENMTPIMQQIQMIKAQKPDLNMEAIAPQIAAHFEKSLIPAQTELLETLGVDESDMDVSTHAYMEEGDGEVLAAVSKFRSLYTGFGGKVEVKLPPNLDEAKMCQVYDAWAEARDKGKNHTMAEFRKGFVSEAQNRVLKEREVALMDEALKNFGLNEVVFNSALQHYMKSSPSFKAKVIEDAQEQAEIEKKTANKG